MQTSELARIAGYLAGAATLTAYFPYVQSVLRKETTPNRASWWIWFVVSLLITLSYRDVGAQFAFFMPAAYTAGCFTISLLSIRFGTGGWTRFDRNCILGAGFGLALWMLFDSPLSALLINLFIDFLGSLPTSRKVFHDPQSENRLAWILFSIGTLLNLFAIEHWTFAEAVYPVCMVFIMGSITVLVLRPFWPNRLCSDESRTR